MVDEQMIYRVLVIPLFAESMIFRRLFIKKNAVQFMEHPDLRDIQSLSESL